jgi:hypothetical protein
MKMNNAADFVFIPRMRADEPNLYPQDTVFESDQLSLAFLSYLSC